MRQFLIRKNINPQIEAENLIQQEEIKKSIQHDLNGKKKIANKRYVLDIETMIDKGNGLYKMEFCVKDKILIGLYDGKEYFEFDNFPDMLRHVYHNSKNAVIYAHNGGRYDYNYLLETCVANKRCVMEKIVTLSSSMIFNLRHKDQVIKFRDSFKILKGSLDSLCKAYNPDVKKMEMNYSHTYTLPEISAYLKDDCVSLFQILEKFEKEINDVMVHMQKEYDISLDDSLTIASLAFKILLNCYLNKKETYNYFSKEHENFIREGYYGGRTELYRFNFEESRIKVIDPKSKQEIELHTTLKYFDVNSLYPKVMRDYEYPLGRGHFIDDSKGNAHKRISNFIFNKNYLGIIRAKIKYPKRHICILPVKTNGGTIYPYGIIEGVYTSVELKACIEEGCEVEFQEGIIWFEKGKIFKDFISDFYELKRTATGVKREIAKLLLVSAYGKYGQRRDRSVVVTKQEFLKAESTQGYRVLGDGFFYEHDVENYSNRKTNPTYAVFITAYARLYLYKFMKEIGFDHVYYVDTDSILTDKDMDSKYIDDKELGLFKREYESVLKAYFVSAKLYGIRIKEKYNEKKYEKLRKFRYIVREGEYMIYDIIKAKRVPFEHLKGMTIEEFKRKLDTGQFKFMDRNIISFREKYHRENLKNTISFVNLEEKEIELTGKYKKRIADGNMTYPLCLIEKGTSPIELFKSDSNKKGTSPIELFESTK